MGRKNRKAKPTLAIVGDGYTEKIYFEDFKNTHRDMNLAIYPKLPGNTGPTSTIEKAIALQKEGYDDVYALIDMDVIVGNAANQVKYNTLKKKAEKLGVHVLENNPCFEMWILCHFVKTGKVFDSCNSVIAEIQKSGRIPEYSKNQEYLKKAKLYSSYKDLIKPKAIPNAQFLENDRDEKGDKYPRAQVYMLMEKLIGE